MSTTAKSRWSELASRHTGPLQRARDAARLTIPALLPPEGADDNTILPTPYQSLGARGVNNLASKLLLALFPPGASFTRLRIEDDVKAKLEKKQLKITEASLVTLENRIVRRIETGNLRASLYAALKHLIVCGNALLHLPKTGARMFRLDQFRVVRTPAGRVVEGVIKENVHPVALTPEVRAACKVNDSDDKTTEVYTWIRLEGDMHRWHQEINDVRVPGSSGQSKEDETPWLFLRWQGGIFEDYGRGHVEEYIGDLRSLEGLSKSIVGFSAIAAKIILLLNPNSTLTEDDVENADIGDVLTGDPEDLKAFSLEKFNDFRVAKETLDEITIRLSHAFLLRSGTTREAERVTAEEIRQMAQELEDVLGGVYTVQSQETQLRVAKRIIADLRDEGEFPAFPKLGKKEVVTPTIITGFDALGRGHELNRLRGFYQDAVGMLGPEAVMAEFHPQRTLSMLSTFHNVTLEDMLMSEDEKKQRGQQMRQTQVADTLLDKAAAPVAKALTERRSK
jgi:6-pyruvoyl-tetrahydropterin synthase